jgi:hypothetical protein
MAVSRLVSLSDVVALVAFAAVGALTHDASLGAFARDAACFLGGWLAAGLVTRRLLLQWLLGVAVALAARALLVGHAPPVAFVLTTYAFVLLFVYAARNTARTYRKIGIRRQRSPRA